MASYDQELYDLQYYLGGRRGDMRLCYAAACGFFERWRDKLEGCEDQYVRHLCCAYFGYNETMPNLVEHHRDALEQLEAAEAEEERLSLVASAEAGGYDNTRLSMAQHKAALERLEAPSVREEHLSLLVSAEARGYDNTRLSMVETVRSRPFARATASAMYVPL